MGNCVYCGKPAGFLRSKHAECEEQQLQRELLIQDGRQRIAEEVYDAITSSGNFDEMEKLISEIEQSSFVPSSERKDHLIRGWEVSVMQILEDGIIDATEEKRLFEFKDRFSLSQADLDVRGAYTKILKAAVLRDVFNGKIPLRYSFPPNLPINFQRGEILIWAFPDSEYHEDKTRRHYEGGSQGISVRIMKGLYYRVGAFKAHPVESTERVHIDTGWVVIGHRNIYFAGSKKSVRIPLEKILSFEPFDNGIGVMRDTANAKLQIFMTGDGWFIYNLVTNLAKLGTQYQANPSTLKPFNPLKRW